eukprot:2417902-Prymnesium_polylepis.2
MDGRVSKKDPQTIGTRFTANVHAHGHAGWARTSSSRPGPAFPQSGEHAPPGKLRHPQGLRRCTLRGCSTCRFLSVSSLGTTAELQAERAAQAEAQAAEAQALARWRCLARQKRPPRLRPRDYEWTCANNRQRDARLMLMRRASEALLSESERHPICGDICPHFDSLRAEIAERPWRKLRNRAGAGQELGHPRVEGLDCFAVMLDRLQAKSIVCGCERVEEVGSG